MRRGGPDSAVVTSTVARLSLDQGEVMAEGGWGLGCSNNSVYLEYYSFPVRLRWLIVRGVCSEVPGQTIQSSTPVLPWAMVFLVLGITHCRR